MERTEQLIKSNDGQHYLVMWVHETGHTQFVVCSHYNSYKKIGSQWDWGHYFEDLVNAVEYWKEMGYNE